MDRVYALRNDENDLYLGQEAANLQNEITALQQALRIGVWRHQAQPAESPTSNDDVYINTVRALLCRPD